MARKRRIPVRKHHGIRDPLKQLEDKEKKLANVLNCPPQRGDNVKVSHKFAQFKKIADRVKSGKALKKRTNGCEDFPKSSFKNKSQSNGSKIKAIKQFLNETDEDYLKRVNRVTSDSLKEAQYEAKYGVEIVRNASTGEISIQKKPKNEIDALLEQKKKESLQKNKFNKNSKKSTLIDSKLDKELIKNAIRKHAEERKNDEEKIVEYQHDLIRFGEVVHAPPSLTLPRKAQKNETVARPGKKNNLLLKKIVEEENTSNAYQDKKSKVAKAWTPTKAQLKGKRKDLPPHTRSMLEAERNKLVEIYRKLKKSKLKSQWNFN